MPKSYIFFPTSLHATEEVQNQMGDAIQNALKGIDRKDKVILSDGSIYVGVLAAYAFATQAKVLTLELDDNTAEAAYVAPLSESLRRKWTKKETHSRFSVEGRAIPERTNSSGVHVFTIA